MRKLLGVVIVAAVGAVGVLACDDYPVTTAQVERSGGLQLQKISGDDQTGAPGQDLNDPYVVKMVDGAGGAVPGMVVRFRIADGDGGSLSSSRVVTDSAGNATVTARLPDTTGVDQTVVARADSAVNSVTFTSSARSSRAGAADIRVVAGDDQKGITRDTLLDPLAVEVTNAEGVALPDVAVKWRVVSEDGGSVRGSPTRTNAEGIARNFWRLGNAPGATDRVIAWIEPSGAAPDTARFSASVTGVPDTIVVTQGAVELDNTFKDPEVVIGDTVFVAPDHWARDPFKATVLDAAGRTVRGAVLSWTVTSRGGEVGDEPEDGDPETVKVLSATDGGVTVWRGAGTKDELLAAADEECIVETESGFLEVQPDCWIGATLSMEQYPGVSPVTLDALIRED